MSNSDMPSDSLAAALAGLRADLERMDAELERLNRGREKILSAIVALEALEESEIDQEPPPRPRYRTRVRVSYENMTMIDAARLILTHHPPLTTRQVADKLIAGGFRSDSENPVNNVGVMLRRYLNGGEHGIVRTDEGLWTVE